MSKGKIIKQGSYHSRLCGVGTLTLREDRIQAYCPRIQELYEFMLTEITRFRMTKAGFYVDNFYFRVDNRTEWVNALKQALEAIGIDYEATGYRII